MISINQRDLHIFKHVYHVGRGTHVLRHMWIMGCFFIKIRWFQFSTKISWVCMTNAQKFRKLCLYFEKNPLTLKWPRYFPPVCAQVGLHGTPKKTTFPMDFFDEYYTIYLSLKTTIFKQKHSKETSISCFKIAAKLPFSFCTISISAKIGKTTFPKGIFQW